MTNDVSSDIGYIKCKMFLQFMHCPTMRETLTFMRYNQSEYDVGTVHNLMISIDIEIKNKTLN